MTSPKDTTTTPVSPDQLKAVAHPARVAILEQLGYRGPMTATELAALVDDSPSNLSWHLRKLAEARLVEPAPSRGGRHRPWQLAVDSYTFDEQAISGPVPGVVAHRQVDRMLSSLAANPPGPSRWASNAGWLTVAEGAEVSTMLAAIDAYLEERAERRGNAAARPEGAVLYEFAGWLAPIGEAL